MKIPVISVGDKVTATAKLLRLLLSGLIKGTSHLYLEICNVEDPLPFHLDSHTSGVWHEGTVPLWAAHHGFFR